MADRRLLPSLASLSLVLPLLGTSVALTEDLRLPCREERGISSLVRRSVEVTEDLRLPCLEDRGISSPRR